MLLFIWIFAGAFVATGPTIGGGNATIGGGIGIIGGTIGGNGGFI